jgi:predicted phosphoribosyltransferase
MLRFSDRRDAGRRLARRLQRFSGRQDVVVVGLPRGGVRVAYEVARALRAPLETLSVRKISAPHFDNVSIGAVAAGGVTTLEPDLIEVLRIPKAAVDGAMRVASLDVRRREDLYRDGRPFPDITGKTVIVVDDGLATGSTMVAAVRALRAMDPAKIVVAAPVGAADVCARIRCLADECVLALAPFPFHNITDWYQNFEPMTDDEVVELLSAREKPLYPWPATAGSDQAAPFVVWSQPT